MRCRLPNLRLKGFGVRRDGSVSIVMAVCASVLIMAGGVMIDLGWIYLRGRQLQGMADLAAMSAVQNLSNGQAAAVATVAANSWAEPVTTQLVTGVYTADPALAAPARFQATTVSPTAAQVSLSSAVPLFFGGLVLGGSTLTLQRTATAASAQLASFSVGSGLATVQGGIANALLSALAGGQIQLSALDYNALVGAHVDLFQYLSALRTRASLQGASFSDLLATQVTTPTALSALSDALAAKGSSQAASAVTAIAAASTVASPVKLNALFDLGPYAGQDHVSSAASAGVSLPAMSMASAILTQARGGQQLSADLGAAALGATDVTVQLAIGQRPVSSPWLRVNDDSSVVVSTSQMRLSMAAQLIPVSSVLTLVGVANVQAQAFIQAASAQAKLSSITCAASPSANAVALSASPSLGSLAFGQPSPAGFSNFGAQIAVSPGTLVNIGAVQATGLGEVDLGGQSWQSVAFNDADIVASTAKTVSTANVAQASMTSLLANTNLQVQVGGAGVVYGPTAMAAALKATLVGASAGLDSVLDQVERIAGLRLGYADLTVNGLRCHGAALVG